MKINLKKLIDAAHMATPNQEEGIAWEWRNTFAFRDMTSPNVILELAQTLKGAREKINLINIKANTMGANWVTEVSTDALAALDALIEWEKE